jgi:NRPS condensation-like uncharacterized protein
MADAEYPLSLLQHEMFLMNQSNKTARDNIYGALRMAGRLDVNALSAAFNAVVAHHEALRTRIIASSVPRQRVEKAWPPLELEEVGDLAAAVRIADTEAQTRIDLEDIPLWRVRLLRLARDEHIFVFVFHHIILDGRSLYIFLQDLAAAYSQCLQRRVPELARIELSYGDLCRIERNVMTRSAVAQQLAHWRSLLPFPFVPLELPLDYARGETAGLRGEVFPLGIDSVVTSAVRSRARREKTTVFNVILSAFAIRIARDAGVDEVVVGVPVGNRASRIEQHVIGYFANIVPFIIKVSRDGLTSEMIQRMKAVSVGALRYPRLPPELLMRRLYANEGVPYRCCLNLQTPKSFADALPDLKLSGIDITNGSAEVDYYLFLFSQPDSFSGRLIYDCEIIRRPRAEGFWRGMSEILGTA